MTFGLPCATYIGLHSFSFASAADILFLKRQAENILQKLVSTTSAQEPTNDETHTKMRSTVHSVDQLRLSSDFLSSVA